MLVQMQVQALMPVVLEAAVLAVVLDQVVSAAVLDQVVSAAVLDQAEATAVLDPVALHQGDHLDQVASLVRCCFKNGGNGRSEKTYHVSRNMYNIFIL